jgi:hypothetical protein
LDALNVTPFGSAPDSANVGAGDPVAVTVKVPATPIVKAMLPGLENPGAVLATVLDVVQPATNRTGIRAKIARILQATPAVNRKGLDIAAIPFQAS